MNQDILNFITDDELRLSLISDYKELELALKNSCFKSVYVLAGSIIETILVDHFITINPVEKDKTLKKTLNPLIDEAAKLQIISENNKNLLTVLRDYRNLIHPGRSIRLKEKITRSGAKIARELVDLMLEEINTNKKKEYGYTSDQLLEKIIHDSSVPGILQHLIKDMNEHEIEKLLLDRMPQSYNEIYNAGEEYYPLAHSSLDTIRQSFQIIFKSSNVEIKTKVLKKYVDILKTESDYLIKIYDNAFINLNFLHLLSSDDQNLIIDHFLSQLENPFIDLKFTSLYGLGKYTKGKKSVSYLRSLAMQTIAENNSDQRKLKEHLIFSEFENLEDEDKELVIKLLKSQQKYFQANDENNNASGLEKLIINLEFSLEI